MDIKELIIISHKIIEQLFIPISNQTEIQNTFINIKSVNFHRELNIVSFHMLHPQDTCIGIVILRNSRINLTFLWHFSV